MNRGTGEGLTPRQFEPWKLGLDDGQIEMWELYPEIPSNANTAPHWSWLYCLFFEISEAIILIYLFLNSKLLIK